MEPFPSSLGPSLDLITLWGKELSIFFKGLDAPLNSRQGRGLRGAPPP